VLNIARRVPTQNKKNRTLLELEDQVMPQRFKAQGKKAQAPSNTKSSSDDGGFHKQKPVNN
jgi:hypothetical protein